MKLNPPWCSGTRRPHPQETMRVERQDRGAIPVWRCSQCHHSIPVWENDSPLDTLPQTDSYAAIVSGPFVRDTGWSRPLQLRYVPDGRDPRLVQIECRTVDTLDRLRDLARAYRDAAVGGDSLRAADALVQAILDSEVVAT